MSLQWEKGNMVTTDHQPLPREGKDKRTHLDGKVWQTLGQNVRRRKEKQKSTKLRILKYINEWRGELIISQFPEVLSHFKDSDMVPAALL